MQKCQKESVCGKVLSMIAYPTTAKFSPSTTRKSPGVLSERNNRFVSYINAGIKIKSFNVKFKHSSK